MHTDINAQTKIKNSKLSIAVLDSRALKNMFGGLTRAGEYNNYPLGIALSMFFFMF